MQEATSSGGKSLSIDLKLNDEGQLNGVSVNGEGILQPSSTDSGEASEQVFTGNGPLDTLLTALLDTWDTFIDHLPVLGISTAAIVLFGLLATGSRRLVRRITNKTGVRHGIGELVGNLFFLGFWLIGLLVAVKIFNPEISAGRIVAIIGVASLALSFIFRDVVENFFAGLLMLWQFPFENGDYIELKTDQGVVKGEVVDVQLRMTLIREISNELLVVPNAVLYKAPLRINTWQELRRDTLNVQIPYEEDIGRAREVIIEAVSACELVAKQPKVYVFASEFADSGCELNVAWWADSAPLKLLLARDQVVEAVKAGLGQANIEIPYPHRKLLLPEAATSEAISQLKTQPSSLNEPSADNAASSNGKQDSALPDSANKGA